MKSHLWSLLLLVSLCAIHAQEANFTEKECPAIKSTLVIPKGWFFLETKDPEDGGTSYLVTKEKLEGDYDSFKTGMTLNVIRKVNEQMNMKASEYAKTLLEQSEEKDDTAKTETSEEGSFKIFKNIQSFDTDDGKLVVVTLLKANDQADTLYHFTWQYPEKEEAAALEIWKEILKRIKLDSGS